MKTAFGGSVNSNFKWDYACGKNDLNEIHNISEALKKTKASS